MTHKQFTQKYEVREGGNFADIAEVGVQGSHRTGGKVYLQIESGSGVFERNRILETELIPLAYEFVKRWNHHDELVAALRAAHEALHDRERFINDDLYNQIQTALHKVVVRKEPHK